MREIGAGFTAQSVSGVEADACAETAAEMMVEARSMSVSNVSSENGSVQVMEGELFAVPELPRPADAVQVSPGLTVNTYRRRDVGKGFGLYNPSPTWGVLHIYAPLFLAGFCGKTIQ